MAQKKLNKMIDLDALYQQRLQEKEKLEKLQELEQSQDSTISSVDSDWRGDLDDAAEEGKSILSRNPEGLDVISQNHLHYLFKIETVSILWLDPHAENSKHEVVKGTPSQLLKLIGLEFQSLCNKQSTCNAACRYLFYVLSVHKDFKTCFSASALVRKSIESQLRPWSIPVADFIAVVLNFGIHPEKFHLEDLTLPLPACIEDPEEKYCSEMGAHQNFPLSNLMTVIELLGLSLKRHGKTYRHAEKQIVLYVLVVLAGTEGIMKSYAFIRVVKDCISQLLDSYTDEEWQAEAWRKVEDLIAACNLLKMNDIEDLLWRIRLFNAGTRRGKQMRCAAAFTALQQCIGSEIVIQGNVVISEVLGVVKKFRSPNALNDNVSLAYKLTQLTSLAVNTDLFMMPSEKDALYAMADLVTKWKHCIFDHDKAGLVDRQDVKNLMTQVHSSWSSLLPPKHFFNV